jgi:chloramphenicol 3-O phosphotransferase
MYQAIADHSRLGVNVVADATHHESYSQPLGILATCAELLRDLPVLFVGVRCRIDVIRARRRATWGGAGYTESSVTDDPVDLWQRALDAIGPYDLTIDTSVTSPTQSAEIIRDHLTNLVRPSALQRYASSTSWRRP